MKVVKFVVKCQNEIENTKLIESKLNIHKLSAVMAKRMV